MSGLLAGKVWLSALPSHLKPLAATLADIANDDGTSIYPTLEYVAWRLGAGVRTVSRNIGELVDMKVLTEITPAHHHRPPEYHLDESKLPKRESWGANKKKNRVAKMAPLNSSEGSHERQSGWPSETGRVATDDRSGWPFEADSLPLSLNDPSLETSVDPSGKRESPAEAGPPTAEQLVELWNGNREPGPKVSKLTHQRRRLYVRALTDEPNLTAWLDVIVWLNGQAYANASGVGEHGTWRADLDWLAKPGQLTTLLDKARTDAAAPSRRARHSDPPTYHLTEAEQAARLERRRQRDVYQQQQDERRAQAADLVLGMSDKARAILEREALVVLEQYRARMFAGRFDEMVCNELPRVLMRLAGDRPLVDVVAELEGQVVAA